MMTDSCDVLIMTCYIAHSRYSARATRILFHTRKVMDSCVKMEQLNNAYKWALGLIYNLYEYSNNNLFGRNLIDEHEYIMALECLKETYHRILIEIEYNEAYNRAKEMTKGCWADRYEPCLFEKAGRENW